MTLLLICRTLTISTEALTSCSHQFNRIMGNNYDEINKNLMGTLNKGQQNRASTFENQTNQREKMWSKIKVTSENTVEYLHTRTPHAPRNERHLLSLESRRLNFDMCLLHDIIHNGTLNDLSDQSIYRNTNDPRKFNISVQPAVHKIIMDMNVRL